MCVYTLQDKGDAFRDLQLQTLTHILAVKSCILAGQFFYLIARKQFVFYYIFILYNHLLKLYNNIQVLWLTVTSEEVYETSGK